MSPLPLSYFSFLSILVSGSCCCLSCAQDPFLNKGWLAFKIALAAHPLTILSGADPTAFLSQVEWDSDSFVCVGM